MKEGDLGFIFATRGVGKTWLALDLALGIAAGRDVGPWKVRAPQSVLYLDGEMSLEDVKKRDRGLNGVIPTLTYISHELLFERTGKIMNLADSELQEAILEMCIRDGFKVLLLDNLSTLVSEVRENEGGDWELLHSVCGGTNNGCVHPSRRKKQLYARPFKAGRCSVLDSSTR